MVGVDDVLRMNRHCQFGIHQAVRHTIDPNAVFATLDCLLFAQLHNRRHKGAVRDPKGRGPQSGN